MFLVKFGCDLDEVKVFQLDVLGVFVGCPHIDLAVSDTEIVCARAVEVSFDPEGLEDKGALKACTYVDYCVFRKVLHSDKYSL